MDDDHLTNIRLWQISGSLPESMRERIIPLSFDILPYLALLHAEIARFTLPCGSIVTVALILTGISSSGPALSGCIILWSSDFPLRRHEHPSGHPDLLFLKPDEPVHPPRYFARAAHAQSETILTL